MATNQLRAFRSKTKIEGDFSGKLEDAQLELLMVLQPNQAPVVLQTAFFKTRFYLSWPTKKRWLLVMCEVLDSTGAPHESTAVL